MYFDSNGNINKRIEKAKNKARRIFEGNYTTLEEAILILKWKIASHWSIPLWSDYFDDLELEQLVFESELISMATKPKEERVQETFADYQEEAESLFDDWEEENQNQWVDLTQEKTMDDSEINEIEKRFMETGQFEGE